MSGCDEVWPTTGSYCGPCGVGQELSSEVIGRALRRGRRKGEAGGGSPWLEWDPSSSFRRPCGSVGKSGGGPEASKEDIREVADGGKTLEQEGPEETGRVADCPNGACAPRAVGARPPPPDPVKAASFSGGWKAPARDIFRPFLEAVREFSMIRGGDKVLVCLSGRETAKFSNYWKFLRLSERVYVVVS